MPLIAADLLARDFGCSRCPLRCIPLRCGCVCRRVLLAAAFAEGNSAVKATADEQARYSSGTPRTCYRSTGRASTFSPGFPELRAIEARLASQELDLQKLCGKNVAEMLPNVAGEKKCSRKRVQLLPGKNVAEIKT